MPLGVFQAARESWNDESRKGYGVFTAAALMSTGFFIGAGSNSSCEQGKKRSVTDPDLYKGESGTKQGPPLKDPMTVYAKMAIKRETEGIKGSQTRTAQATSPANNAAVDKVSSKYINELTADELRIEEATRKAMQHSGGLKLFSGNGNMALSLEIARHLGMNLGRATVGKFADGEANVVIHENVRGKDVYIVQPTCPPVNDNIMELLLMVSTLRRASARRITVVIPYYGYARQDRKMQVRCASISFFAFYVLGTHNTHFRLVYPFLLQMLLGSWRPWESTVSLQ